MHDIKLFEPGRSWTTETGHFTYTGVDAARNICLALISVVALSACGILLFDSNMFFLSAILVPIFPFFMKKMIKSHWKYGADKGKVNLIEKIDSLPPEYRARFGTDYRQRIMKTYDTNRLRHFVNQLHASHENLVREQAKFENDVEDLVQAAIESASESNERYKDLAERVAMLDALNRS
jgi:hypothetical protein